MYCIDFHMQCLKTLREREKILQQLRELVKVLTSERDNAIALLNHHGIPVNQQVHVTPTYILANN